MERRKRTRIIPHKELLAYVADSQTPSEVLDYSASGLAIRSEGEKLDDGLQYRVDLVMNGVLVACAVPGIVRWSSEDAVGIDLAPKNAYQVEAAYEIESEVTHY